MISDGLTPTRSRHPPSLLFTPLSQRRGIKTEWVWEVLWIKGTSLMRKAKPPSATKALSISWQVSSNCLECKASAHVTIAWEARRVSECCPSPQILLVSTKSYGVVLASLGQLCLLPSSCPLPAIWLFWGSEDRDTWCCVSPFQAQAKHESYQCV